MRAKSLSVRLFPLFALRFVYFPYYGKLHLLRFVPPTIQKIPAIPNRYYRYNRLVSFDQLGSVNVRFNFESTKFIGRFLIFLFCVSDETERDSGVSSSYINRYNRVYTLKYSIAV